MKNKKLDSVPIMTEEEVLPDDLGFILSYMYKNGAHKGPIFVRGAENVPNFSLLLKREYVDEDDHGRFVLTERGTLRGAYESMKDELKNVE